MKRLWQWYGRRRGWLKAPADGFYLHGERWDEPRGITWVGHIPKGTYTLRFVQRPFSVCLFNRRVDRAELDELNDMNR